LCRMSKSMILFFILMFVKVLDCDNYVRILAFYHFCFVK